MKIRRSKRAKRRARGQKPEQVHYALGLTVDGKFKGTRAQRKFQRAINRKVVEYFRTLASNLPPMLSLEELAAVRSMNADGKFSEFLRDWLFPDPRPIAQICEVRPMTAEEIAQQPSVRRAIRYLGPFIENAQPLDFNEESHGT